MILNLAPEIIHVIFGECEMIEDILNFGRTCRRIRSNVLYFLRGKEGAIYMASRYAKSKVNALYKEQMKGLLALKAHPEQNIFIRALFSSGKTLLALMHAEESWKMHGIRTMIVATPKCFTSWIDHIRMLDYKLVKSRPEKSDVIVFHSSCKGHRDFILSSSNRKLESTPHYIFLTTTYYMGGSHSSRSATTRLVNLHHLCKQIIVDESHLLKDRIGAHIDSFERKIYLSASPMDHLRDFKILDLVNKNKKSNGSSVKMKYSFVSSKGSGVDLIKDLLTKEITGRKIVLFTHWDTLKMKQGMAWLKSNVPGYRFVRFYNTSEFSLSRFRKSKERCVLVTTIFSASEGTNFEMADTAVYMDFGRLVPQRARQCFGRIRRRNNQNPVVYNYLVYDTNNPVSYINTRLNLHNALDLRLELSKKKGSTVNKIYRMMAKDGIRIRDLPKPDFVTIFGDNNGNRPLPFKEEDYTLPLFQMIGYMNII